jgi:hypothetical protein
MPLQFNCSISTIPSSTLSLRELTVTIESSNILIIYCYFFFLTARPMKDFFVCHALHWVVNFIMMSSELWAPRITGRELMVEKVQYIIIFDVAIWAKHCQFGQCKPVLPHIADEDNTRLTCILFGSSHSELGDALITTVDNLTSYLKLKQRLAKEQWYSC